MRQIDADALLEELQNCEASGGHKFYRAGMNDTLHYHLPKIIENQPTIEPVQGHWEDDGTCSACKKNIYDGIDADFWSRYNPPFCPKCGAAMDNPSGF